MNSVKSWRERSSTFDSNNFQRQAMQDEIDELRQYITSIEIVNDGVWEALQRLIENSQLQGPSSRDDALLVAQWRRRFRSQR